MEYKLIKKYPSLPKDWETGMIIGQGDRGTYADFSPCDDKYRNFYIICPDVVNYPEFWQPVIEKDYKILELSIQRSDKHQIVSALGNSEEYNISLLNCNGNKIHSVKRLSDSQIFTIGDELKNNQKIISISLIDNQIRIYPQYSFYYLRDIVKVKQKLFTTFDNVDIFKGDISFGVNSNFKLSEVKHINKLYIYPNVKEFSTKEKAEEFILLNKPCLSYDDIQDYLKVKDCNKVLDLVQLKIQQSV